MPRRKNLDTPIEKSISLPESLCTKIDVLLWSELEGRVPFGAWGTLIKSLLEQHLARVQQGASNASSKG
jgi:hypothetical protein